MNFKNMTIPELAGQRLMVGFDGTEMNEDIQFLIRTLKVGGLILFSRNIDSIRQVATLISEAQAYARENNLPPLFISVDQEGGTVARFKESFTRFKGNPFIDSKDKALVFARTVSDELHQVGVNMNMAPVLDIAFEPDSIMIDRAFPGGPQQVADLGTHVITGMQENNMMAVAKHFPGIGRTKKDSHFELPVLKADPELIMKSDLLPFTRAKEAGVAGMMLSHILYEQLDPMWPASLSPQIAGKLLRKKIGYQGLVLTDDLDMKAIQHEMSITIRQILLADIDIVLICHKGPDIQKAHDEIMGLISDDEDFLDRAKQSLGRIMALKRKFLSA